MSVFPRVSGEPNKINNKLSFLIALANQRFMFIAVECSLACNCVHVRCSNKKLCYRYELVPVTPVA